MTSHEFGEDSVSWFILTSQDFVEDSVFWSILITSHDFVEESVSWFILTSLDFVEDSVHSDVTRFLRSRSPLIHIEVSCLKSASQRHETTPSRSNWLETHRHTVRKKLSVLPVFLFFLPQFAAARTLEHIAREVSILSQHHRPHFTLVVGWVIIQLHPFVASHTQSGIIENRFLLSVTQRKWVNV